jgi:MtrB/PioB family decaheme-associated outer membrane protein
VRRYPRTVNTSLQGSGTTTPIVSLLAAPGTGADLDLKTERKRLSVGGEKWFGPHLMMELSFSHEDKDGARLFGRGFTCPSGAAPAGVCTALASGANQWALLMLPEPIDSSIRQYEAKVNYLGDRFSVTAGFYGSFYVNNNGALTPVVNGNLNNPLGQPMGQGSGVALTEGLRNILQLPMALPPDNQANQFYVSGNYAFTPTTRATFKYAHTHATQKDDFASNGFTDAPAGVSNYGGVVDTTLAQAGLTARPIPKLSLVANIRYEDREDKSPLALYNIEGANRFINGTYSLKKTAGKLEGTYALPAGLRGTLGVDYEALDRGQLSSPECIELGTDCVGDSVAGITALRAKTDETTWRAELRRSMTETISGAISFSHSKRDGSSWLKPAALPATGVVEISDEQVYNRTGIFPSIFMNRTRDKVKVRGDWSPVERVSVQFTAEGGTDKYEGPTQKGLEKTGMRLYGVDVAYALTEAWKLSAYYSYSEQTMHVAHSTGYIAALKDKNSTAGLNLAGKVSPKLQLGADVLYTNDRNIYDQSLDSLASPANVAFFNQFPGLPDVTFRDLRLKVFGKYALARDSDVRVEVVHDRQNLNEWTWGYGAPFAYSDNTTVGLQPNQRVTFVSVAWQYRFR